MTNKPRDSDDRMLTDEEREANLRFQEALERLATTPHKPHETLKKGRGPKAPPGG